MLDKKEIKKPKLLTSQEKFIKMNEKNKNLLVLKKEFNLNLV